jgi:hypothetical protein
MFYRHVHVVSEALTRKEEILRFNRAQTDTEFAKMLKSRTLGPEHLETQSQLRRDIKVRNCFPPAEMPKFDINHRLSGIVFKSWKITSKLPRRNLSR